MDFLPLAERPQPRKLSRHPGFVDTNGRYISFAMAEDVFHRARRIGTRVLLRLVLDEDDTLHGVMYTNERGVTDRRAAQGR